MSAPPIPIALVLGLGTVALYWPAGRFEFINFDDPHYVYDNPEVRAGLTLAGVRWAFTTGHAANWHPLTWLSHMLDVQLFGLDPGAHHLTNVLLHAVNAVLLFLLLEHTTGRPWRAAFVAALFAWHPLRVESVAWVAERKDVLGTCFWILTIGAYVRWVGRPGRGRYAALLVTFALGLMAKPMLVTLPLVLCLLDFWPLGRWRRADALRLLREKVPLALLAAAASVATFVAQRAGGAVVPTSDVTVPARAANALVSYACYLWLTIWPSGLTIFYPYRPPSPWAIGAAGVTVVGISALVCWAARSRPYLVVGWLWYLVTLVPVIGLVQVGSQAMADRYTYVPLVGPSVAVVWFLAELADRRPRLGVAMTAAGVAALTGCVVVTTHQLAYWRDSATLFGQALAVTSGNYVAHNSIGNVLEGQGRLDEAHHHFAEAVRFNPRDARARNNLGNTLVKQGKLDEAEAHFRTALALRPDYPEAHANLGDVLLRLGRFEEATGEYQAAARLRPDWADVHVNLGHALERQGRIDDAVAAYRQAVRVRPEWAEAHFVLGAALANSQRVGEAIAAYREALRVRPGWPVAAGALAWLLATSPDERLRDGAEAIRLVEGVAAGSGGEMPQLLDTLAAAYAESGRFPEAVATARQGMARARAMGDERLAQDIARHLGAYEAGEPVREGRRAVEPPP